MRKVVFGVERVLYSLLSCQRFSEHLSTVVGVLCMKHQAIEERRWHGGIY